MATIADIRNDVHSRIRSALLAMPAAVGLPSPIVIVWAMTDGDNLPPDPPGNKPWARVQVKFQEGRTTSISGRLRRINGELSIQLFLINKTSAASAKIQDAAGFVSEFISNTLGETNLEDVHIEDRQGEADYVRCDIIGEFWFMAFGRPES